MLKQRIPRLVIQAAITALVLTFVIGISPLSAAQRDRTPPTTPVVSVAEVGSRHVTLTWTPSNDNSPYIWYFVFLNGSQFAYAGGNTSITIQGLTPATTYTFTVRARDNGINWSPDSNAVTVTTTSNQGDTTAPTTPTNLNGFDGGCGEAWMNWTQSTDNVDPQVDIWYEIYVNGVARPESTSHGYGRTIAYAVTEGTNTFEVFAVDSAGNRSAPASITLQMSPPC